MSSRRNVSTTNKSGAASSDDWSAGFRVAASKPKGGARGRGGMTVVHRGGRDLSALTDNDNSESSVHHQAAVEEDVFQEKITIPQGSSAFIIGRGGVNAKRIRELGCRLQVKDTVVVMQSNSRQTVQQAKKIVQDLLKKYGAQKQAQVNTQNLLVLPDAVGPLDGVLQYSAQESQKINVLKNTKGIKGAKAKATHAEKVQRAEESRNVPLITLQSQGSDMPLNTFEKTGEEKAYYRLQWNIAGVNVADLLEQEKKAAEEAARKAAEEAEGEEETGGDEDDEYDLASLAKMKKSSSAAVNQSSGHKLGHLAAHSASAAESAAQKEQAAKDAEDEENGLVQRIELSNESQLKSQPLTSLAKKLYEQKQKQVMSLTGNKYRLARKTPAFRKMSFNVEANLGHKLFFASTGAAAPAGSAPVAPGTQKQIPESLQKMSVQDLLALRTGHGKELNSMFNTALSEQEVALVRANVKRAELPLKDKRVVIFVQLSQQYQMADGQQRRRRFDLQCHVDLPLNDGEDALQIEKPLPITVSTTQDRNQKLAIIDVLNTKGKFDYRLRAKIFPSDMQFNQDAVTFIQENLAYVVKEHKLVMKDGSDAESAAYAFTMEYRRRIEEIYSNDQIEVMFRRKDEEESRLEELRNRTAAGADKQQQSQDQQEEGHESAETVEDVNPNEPAQADVAPVERRKMTFYEVLVFSELVDKYGDATKVVKPTKEQAAEGEEGEEEQAVSPSDEPDDDVVKACVANAADPELVKLQATPESDIAAAVQSLADFLHNELLA